MPAGIPTTYKGCIFRSRLEATWATFFDEIDWPWRYEPIDLAGYIPDFVLPFPWQELLVEVKPELTIKGLGAHVRKIERSGWRHDALIVGAGPLLDTGVEPSYCAAGLLSQRDHFADGELAGDWCWDKGLLFHCAICGKTSVFHYSQAFNCYRCGGYDGDGHLLSLPSGYVEETWAECQRGTTWRPA